MDHFVRAKKKLYNGKFIQKMPLNMFAQSTQLSFFYFVVKKKRVNNSINLLTRMFLVVAFDT